MDACQSSRSLALVSFHSEPIRGECQAFCPVKEELERVQTQELSRFERPVAGAPEFVAVKKYRRAAAGRDVWDVLELRPAPVLLRTLRHLFTIVLSRPQSGFGGRGATDEFLAEYHFVNDRVRSVRQDFTIQRIEDASLVTALQQIARFYLLSRLRSVQLLGGVKARQDWSDKLNDEQLASALSQLQTLYGMHDLRAELKDAGEFIAYDLLLHADEAESVASMLLKLSPKLRNLLVVRRALRAFVALQTDDFHAFFVQFNTMTLLEQAAALHHLERIWTRSLRMMNKSFGKQDCFPLEELARWMNLADPQSEGEGGEVAEKLCKALNIQSQRHPSLPVSAPSNTDSVAESWELVDGLAHQVASLSVPASVGFAQFKRAPLHDQLDSDAVELLLRDVALRIETDVSALLTTKELIMGTAQENSS